MNNKRGDGTTIEIEGELPRLRKRIDSYYDMLRDNILDSVDENSFKSFEKVLSENYGNLKPEEQRKAREVLKELKKIWDSTYSQIKIGNVDDSY